MIYLNELEEQIKNQLVNRTDTEQFINLVSQLKSFNYYGLTMRYFFNLMNGSIENKNQFSNKVNRLLKSSGFSLIVSKNYKVWLL